MHWAREPPGQVAGIGVGETVVGAGVGATVVGMGVGAGFGVGSGPGLGAGPGAGGFGGMGPLPLIWMSAQLAKITLSCRPSQRMESVHRSQGSSGILTLVLNL